MKKLLRSQVAALAAAALAGTGALAQDIDDVTVQASRVETQQIGFTSSGLPVVELNVTHVVNSADLDLTTDAGMSELQSRVEKAARHGCREIDLTNRLAHPSDSVCARLATRETMARVRALVAAD